MTMTQIDHRSASAATPHHMIDMNIVATATYSAPADIWDWNGSPCKGGIYVQSQDDSSPDERRHRQFEALARRWHRETGMHSVPSRIRSHDAYLRIIGMGHAVLPLILEDLRTSGGDWYAALEAITGASPVPKEAQGRVPLMKSHWLAWGRQREYID